MNRFTTFASLSTAVLASVGSIDAMAQESSLVTRGEQSSWVFRGSVTVRSVTDTRVGQDEIATSDRWSLGTVAMVFPLITQTSSAEVRSRAVDSTFTLNNSVVDERPTFMNSFPVGAQFGRWDFVSPEGKQLRSGYARLQLEYNVTSYDTIYDDEAAEQLDWPDEWPEIAQSSFEPMPFVDYEPGRGEYDMEPVERLIKRWTRGRDPKALKPAVLAKFLAGQVVQHVQPSGDGFAFDRTGIIEGIRVPPVVASRRRGSPVDMAVLLLAVYREAGLPARLVLGIDAEDGERDGEFLEQGGGPPALRAWVEFALVDPRTRAIAWVPVDPVAIRKSSSRMPREYWTKPIEFFGSHDELDGVVPFSFHLFPPTTVRSYGGSGSPGFWGWFVTPTPPERAHQTLDLSVHSQVVRGGQQNQPRRRR